MTNRNNAGIRLKDSGEIGERLRKLVTEGLIAEYMSGAKRGAAMELELHDGGVYDAAAAGSDPALDRLKAVFREYDRIDASAERISAILSRVNRDGLDARLTPDQIGVLAEAMDHAEELRGEPLPNRLEPELRDLDSQATRRLNESEDTVRRAMDALKAREGADGKSKIIDFREVKQHD